MAPNFCVTQQAKLYPENEREGVGMGRRGGGGNRGNVKVSRRQKEWN